MQSRRSTRVLMGYRRVELDFLHPRWVTTLGCLYHLQMEKRTDADTFIERWRGATGSERANYQLFVTGLCELLGVPQPEPASDDARDNAYVFERRVTFAHGDGATSHGFIDCYRRGAFVLEAKKIKAGTHTQGFDDALMRARAQGEGYARALPAHEGRPPFVLVVDVGNVIELYAEFTRSGATYTPFPDPRNHRIKLDDLRIEAVREQLKALWLDPMALDPARASAKVTREVAGQLADVARSLEAAGHSPHDVAAFLARCLFCMFAEDVELLPRSAGGGGAFVDLLTRYCDDPVTLQRMMVALWADMDQGGFSASLARNVLRFNGKLFKAPSTAGYALPLNRGQIDGLLAAARSNWREVEPAIFGTLLEHALDPAERHALGAHYTPRAYVERLVLPTVMEPLRADWANAQAAALLLANEANALDGRKREGKLTQARNELKRFHHRLCTVRVLDPACGSGNFLYVTLEHLKRLEGEVLNQLEALGDTQEKLGLEGETVTLQQLRGVELNERAAALAELVLWIGFLQWHIRTFGNSAIAEPVVHDYGNIECRDAVLAYDGIVPMTFKSGAVVTRWDGGTFKPHPVTGEPVPDESAQVAQLRYVNPRKAEWPVADFIIGNPPFIGNKRMRDALGDGYVEALRGAWPEVPESADFVMYWWQRAADTVRAGSAHRFGLITTNSLTMIFNRRVIEAQQRASPPLHLVFAIPDHPWVGSADGAAVRISMTVGQSGAEEGRILTSIREHDTGDGEVQVDFDTRTGVVHADLTSGANVASAQRLQANDRLSNRGMIPHGAGFVVTDAQASALGLGVVAGLDRHIRPYRNGRDLTDRPRGVLVIDLYGLTADDVRARYPTVFQWLWDRVKPERDQNPERSRRENWWLFARANTELRGALTGLPRFIATAYVAKHRAFQFLESNILPDDMLVAISLDDAFFLGVLSSQLHVLWSLAAGGTLEDRPRYTKSTCFETFPFPSNDTSLTRSLTEHIRTLAEQLDSHRKTRQDACPDVTLTGMYNVLEALRSGRPLTAKEMFIHEHGLVGVLRTLHDELDTAVLAAYGWADLNLPADNDALLERLVTLNARRAAEEAAGTVRWLRPAFQQGGSPGKQTSIVVDSEEADLPAPPAAIPTPVDKRSWPIGLPEQIKAVADVLAASGQPMTLDTIAAHFTARGRWRARLPTILDTLEALGRAKQLNRARWRDTGGT